MSKIEFTWRYPAKVVEVHGSWNNWEEGTRLEKINDLHSIDLTLLPGTYEYKFVVDGKWCYDMEKPIINNGNENNIIQVN
jgi:5'-AMP-activated protein kinase, regulatory beta subunit